MIKTRKNSVTSTKQAIKEMLLQDLDIVKILMGKNGKYKDVMIF